MAWALLVVNSLCIALCYQIARERQANSYFWGLMGFLLGPFAVPFVFFSRPQVIEDNL